MGGRDLEDILIDLEGDWDFVYVGWILLSLLILPCTVQYGINGIRTQYLEVESAWIRNAPGLVRAIDADPQQGLPLIDAYHMRNPQGEWNQIYSRNYQIISTVLGTLSLPTVCR